MATCKAITSSGDQCSFSAKEGKDYCGIHSTKKKRGRKTKLATIDYEQVEKLTKLGATDKELADFYGVSESTINNWKLKDEQFVESLKNGKQIADANVADRLYNRAIGYEHEEDKIFQYEGEPVIVPTVKKYAPDTTAAIFWLKNRRPDAWRDRQEVDLSIREEFDPENGNPEDYIKNRLQRK